MYKGKKGKWRMNINREINILSISILIMPISTAVTVDTENKANYSL